VVCEQAADASPGKVSALSAAARNSVLRAFMIILQSSGYRRNGVSVSIARRSETSDMRDK
jgi:hypothetical protein